MDYMAPLNQSTSCPQPHLPSDLCMASCKQELHLGYGIPLPPPPPPHETPIPPVAAPAKGVCVACRRAVRCTGDGCIPLLAPAPATSQEKESLFSQADERKIKRNYLTASHSAFREKTSSHVQMLCWYERGGGGRRRSQCCPWQALHVSTSGVAAKLFPAQSSVIVVVIDGDAACLGGEAKRHLPSPACSSLRGRDTTLLQHQHAVCV